MNKWIISVLALCMVTLQACHESADNAAVHMLAQAEQLYTNGNYRACLDTISSLRTRYAEAVEVRKKALKLWQDASLKMTQEDIARTDSALQAVTRQYNAAQSIRERNFIGIKKDSLQIRYDALCGTVRVIHRRQQENN